MLSLSLDTNSITFEGYSGVGDVEMLGEVNLTINSSLPYQLNAYMPVGISNADNSQTLDTSMFNIKESSDTIAYAFLNRDLKANEIKVLDVVQAKQNGDNDGDLSAISIIVFSSMCV